MPPVLSDGEGHDIRDILAIDVSHLIDTESAAGSWADALTYSQSITQYPQDSGTSAQAQTAGEVNPLSPLPRQQFPSTSHDKGISPKGQRNHGS